MGGKHTRFPRSSPGSASDFVCDFGHDLSLVWAAVYKVKGQALRTLGPQAQEELGEEEGIKGVTEEPFCGA